jgi:formylglycine-generating enzyme required for sulfatase activity
MKRCAVLIQVLGISLVAVAGCSTNTGPGQAKLESKVLDLGNGVKMEMVLIPAGSFMMGDAAGEACERPVHKVTITKPFYIGKYLVTPEQWESVMGNNPSEFKGPKNPVENVNYKDCQAFLKKLEEKFGPTGAKFSLPTEAQWEYACRAGTTTRYYFGDSEKDLDQYAWFAGHADRRTHPVGEKKPNAWGLYDMHGSVSQWCADCYGEDYYKASPANDPTGPADKASAANDPTGSTGRPRVYRGGGYVDEASDCRAARRGKQSAHIPGSFLGFRVVCTP